MPVTPDWIPNIHPLVVHFPVALLVLAVVIDIVRLFIRKQNWIDKTTLLLYATGTAGLIAAYITGQQAVDTVVITGEASRVVAGHEDWALYTTVFFMLFSLLRIAAYWKNWEAVLLNRLGLTVLAVAGGSMLWYTGELGVKLVFKHGVAVGEVDRLQDEVATLEQTLAEYREDSSPALQDDGSWIWRIGPGADEAITDFTLAGGEEFTYAVGHDASGSYLAIDPGPEKTFLLFGDTIGNIEGEMELNVDNYTGSVYLTHHFRGPDDYQFVNLENGTFSQGQMVGGTQNILASEEVSPGMWFSLRVSASGTHFYGYKSGRTITHTHADEMQPGLSGIAFRGSGELKIRRIEFQALD